MCSPLYLKSVAKAFTVCAAFLTVAAIFAPVWAADGTARCVTDDLGRRVCASNPELRLITLAPSLTETIFALGCGQLLRGRTQRCNQPAEALEVPIVGRYMRPDIEKILAQKPDLVLCTKAGTGIDLVNRLESFGISVFVNDSQSVDAVPELVTVLGKLLRREASAKRIVDDLKRRRESLRKRLARMRRPSVLYLVGVRPLIAAGPSSLLGAALAEAGGENVVTSASISYPRISIEHIIRTDPDVILILNKECPPDVDCLTDLHGLDTLSAVKKGRVVNLDADLMARPSPKIMDALETLAAILHPEALAKSYDPRTHRSSESRSR